jgi:hypothetical protein
LPPRRRKKGLDRRDIPLYCYTYTVDGPDLVVETEIWSGRVSSKDRRIASRLETAPGFGLLWTNETLKEAE